MEEWHEPRGLTANEALIEWLEAGAEPPRVEGIHFVGYELHTHPDLVDRLVDECIQGLPTELVAAFGVPCVARIDGTIIAFAYSTHTIFIRGFTGDPAVRPTGLGDEWGGIDAFFPPAWHGLSVSQRQHRHHEDQRALINHIRVLMERACLVD